MADDIVPGLADSLNTSSGNTTKEVFSDTKKAIADQTKSVLTTPPTLGEAGFFDNIFSNKYKMGNIVGLAGALTQLAAAPTMLEQAKLQNKSLRFNLDTAKDEQARRNKNIAGFNAFNA
jgi:hypothetical protein